MELMEFLWKIGDSFFSEDSNEHKQMQASKELEDLGVTNDNVEDWSILHPPTGIIWKSDDCFYSKGSIRFHFKKILPDLENSQIIEYNKIYSKIKSHEIDEVLFQSFIDLKIIEIYFLPLDNGLMFNSVSIENVLPKKPKPKAKQILTERVVRDTVMIRKLKDKHKFRCQICGKSIKTSNNPKEFYAEGHHLEPLSLNKNSPRNVDVEGNIIILCPNHHIEFQKHVIAIDISDCETILHLDKTSNKFHSKKIKGLNIHTIEKEFIAYHYKKFKKKHKNEKLL